MREKFRFGPEEGAADRRLRTPLYHQVYLILRDRIRAGAWGPNDTLPSETRLAETFAVSRITIRHAVGQLAREGFVDRKQGRGTTVRARPPEPVFTLNATSIIDGLFEMGEETRVTLLSHERGVPPANVAQELALGPGERASRIVRTRAAGGAVFSHIVAYVPEALAGDLSDEELSRRPLLQLLETRGVRIARARQSVSAGLADPTLAAALETEVGAPLLRARRTLFDAAGRPVQHVESSYRPDRFQYWVDLRRSDEAETGPFVVSAAGRVEPGGGLGPDPAPQPSPKSPGRSRPGAGSKRAASPDSAQAR